MLQTHLTYTHVNHIAFRGLNRAIFRKQRDRARLFPVLQNIYRTPPSFSLAVVDLTQIQNMPLHHTSTRNAMVLDDAPVAVLFAVFDTRLHAHEHAAIVYGR